MDFYWQSNISAFEYAIRLVITFLPGSKRLLISWLQSPSAMILEPQNKKSDTVSTVSPSISHEVIGPDAMIFVFWMLSFNPTFSLYTFTFIKRLFSSSSLSAIRVVSSAYLRLLIFLPAMLISACGSSSPVFRESEIAQLCPTLCNPMNCSPLGSLGKNSGVGCHFLLQGIFPTQGSNLGLLHCRQML